MVGSVPQYSEEGNTVILYLFLHTREDFLIRDVEHFAV